MVLWNTHDPCYLTVYAAHAVGTGTLTADPNTLSAGSLGNVEVKGDNVMLGVPFKFDRNYIDNFDF